MGRSSEQSRCIYYWAVKFITWEHRDRELGFFSSRPIWDSPTPSPAGERVPSPLRFMGEGGGVSHSLEETEWGGGGPNSDEGTDTVVL